MMNDDGDPGPQGLHVGRSSHPAASPLVGPRTCLVISALLKPGIPRAALQSVVDALCRPEDYPPGACIAFHDCMEHRKLPPSQPRSDGAEEWEEEENSDEENEKEQVPAEATCSDEDEGPSTLATATEGESGTGARILLVVSVAASFLQPRHDGTPPERALLEVLRTAQVSLCTERPIKVLRRCSVWVTAPCMVPLLKRGVDDLTMHQEQGEWPHTLTSHPMHATQGAASLSSSSSLGAMSQPDALLPERSRLRS
jgi:hypothetical protein